MHTRATPGVYAMERSSRVLTETLPLTSILPPRCMRKVRSETFFTVTPSTVFTAAVIRWPCPSSLALQLMSRVMNCEPASTRSMAPISPPASPIAEVTLPSIPGLLAIWTRMVRL